MRASMKITCFTLVADMFPEAVKAPGFEWKPARTAFPI